ncbi:L-Ala-D/L-Glu epimerase [Izhakiella australiensis]|uniref:Dipeptide epimerase n=1 Tax=Izhakiella australiensis TaxID=1926881 RepID=A0A1S8YQ31_9GAMM|nr:L-Ala-D/L-Glu epimerase [Izhakiella australiensis]OON41174.1 L-Ala-D/L-Glu epimerase [Izhakiella australiensis]
MRQVNVYPETWPLNAPFIIARGSRSEAVVLVVEIEQDGVKGIGECTPYPRYGESVASVMAQINSLKPALEQGLSRHLLQQQLAAGAARNAIDCALWDLECRQQQQNLWQKTGAIMPDTVFMAQTVSIDTPEVMALNAGLLVEKGAQLLKVKLDNHLITERLMAIRASVPEVALIVDANESWEADGLAARCQLLADLKVKMLEQPLKVGDDAVLGHFIHPLPICADESCHTRDSLVSLHGRYDLINIKLDKTGGLTEALALAQLAKAEGFEIMLGCMLCTSRAISAALPLVPDARFIDLDGPTWLARDVEPPLAFSCGRIDLRSRPA